MSLNECSPEQSEALLGLARASNADLESADPPLFLVAYDVPTPISLQGNIDQLNDQQRLELVGGLLSATEQLHKRRSYHLSISPETLWLTDDGVKLTHQGLFSLFKKRGLSLKRETIEQIDRAIIHRAQYASPEEIFGRLSNQSSDLFAIGALSYQLFIGPLPDPKLDNGEYQRSLSCSSDEWSLFFSRSTAPLTKDRYPNAKVMLEHFNQLPKGESIALSHSDDQPSAQREDRGNEPRHDEETRSHSTEAQQAQPRMSSPVSTLDENYDYESTAKLTPEVLSQLEDMSLDPDQTFSELSTSLEGLDSLDETSLDYVTNSQSMHIDPERVFTLGSQSSSEREKESHRTQGQGQSEELKNSDIQSEELKNSDVQSEELKNSDVQSEELKNSDVPSEELKNSDVRSEELKNSDVQSDMPQATISGSISRDDMPEAISSSTSTETDNKPITTDSALALPIEHADEAPSADVNYEKSTKDSFKVAAHLHNEESDDLEAKDPPQKKKAPPLHQTIGFFSGGTEVSSSQFQSLKSQLSSSTSDQAKRSSPAQEPMSPATDDLNEMAFGATSDDFGFDQSSQDERTFLEFSDVDDQTVFEEDQDLFVEQTHTNAAHQGNIKRPASKPHFQTMSYVSQDNNEGAQANLQTPDFLNDLPGDNQDPSRVMPIPSKAPKGGQGSLSPSSPLEKLSLTPSPLLVDDKAKPFTQAPVITANKVSSQSPQSQILGDAHEWPSAEIQQPVYTPPQRAMPAADNRKAPKMQVDRSAFSRLLSALLPITFIAIGAVGVYWVSSNWATLSKLMATEAPLSLNISTVPSDMRVILNNKPQQDKTPLIHRFEGRYVTGDELPIRFLWERKMHSTKVKLPPGALSLYFLGEQKKGKVSRYRKSSPSKPTHFAQGLITSAGEPLRVLFKGQQIGQTPIVIIGPQNKPLKFMVLGPGIEESVILSLDGTKNSDIFIPNASSSTAESQ